MAGSETAVTGPEAPAAGGLAFGDFDGASGDEFDEASQEQSPRGPRMHRATRDDGLVLEVDEAETAGWAARAHRRPPPVVERAADLAARMVAGNTARPTFESGQRVRHADYGDGVLAAISGTGPRSVGTVIFDGPAGTRKFILGHGALRPVT
jgi:hypothetical protein